jgi:pSer/pThr/pTyr-binding forkhead associated (FHA) protein
MNLRLVVDKERGRRQVFHIGRADAVVGRARGSSVRIPSVEVSRRHCRLRQADGVVTVEDLDSANGTFVNGLPVVARQLVRPGDRLTVGPVTFVVEYVLTDEAVERYEGGSVMEVLSALPEVEKVEEVEELERIDDLSDDSTLDDDLALPMSEEEDEVEEEAEEEEPAERSIFNFDDAHWEMPDGGLRDILSEMDGPDAEADKDKK